MNKFNNFADLASYVAAVRGNDAQIETYEGAFLEHEEMAKMSVVEDAEKLDMSDSEQVRAAVEMMMATMFDVLRDTRMDVYAADLAWGFANGFHVVAKRIEGREDDASAPAQTGASPLFLRRDAALRGPSTACLRQSAGRRPRAAATDRSGCVRCSGASAPRQNGRGSCRAVQRGRTRCPSCFASPPTPTIGRVQPQS